MIPSMKTWEYNSGVAVEPVIFERENEAMMCMICKQAKTQPGFATVTLEREGLILVFKRVPAQVCPNCGEEYVGGKISADLLTRAEGLAQEGAQVDVREYSAS